jgi:hypothetical protein
MKSRSLLLIFVLLTVGTGLQAASTIYVASDFGPYKSTDGGARFTQPVVQVSNPFVGTGVHHAGSIAVNPKNSNIVYFIGGRLLQIGRRRPDATLLGFTFLTGVGRFVINPVATNVLYSVANNGTNNIVVKSVDSGVTWNTTTPIPPFSVVPVNTPNWPRRILRFERSAELAR